MAHKDQGQLLKELEEVKNKVSVGAKYFHYKHPNQFYKVVRVGFIEATEEVCVIYEVEYGENFVWVRTIEEFLAKISLEDGTQVDRFTKVG